MPPHAPSVTSSRPWELQNRTLGSESRFWLSERFLGPIWLTVFWRPDFCRILGGAPSRAQRYLQSPLGASKSNLGLRKQVFAFRTLPRAHLAHSFLRLDSSRILRGALPSVSLQKKARFAPPFCLHVKIKRASRSPPSASFKKEMVLRTSLCFNFFFKKALRAPSVFSLKGRALRALCLGPARPFPFLKKKRSALRASCFFEKKALRASFVFYQKKKSASRAPFCFSSKRKKRFVPCALCRKKGAGFPQK